MSDIHILEGTLEIKVGAVEQGAYCVAFHIPIAAPDGDITNPDFVSQIPKITQGETDAIRAGTLLEIVETVVYLSSFSNVYYSNRMKARWAELNTLKNEEYNFKKKFYLMKIAH